MTLRRPVRPGIAVLWLALLACEPAATPDYVPPGHVPTVNARTRALVAEARRRGLDRDDLIIDRRLVQKLEWAVELEVVVPEPTGPELAAWYASQRARYEVPETTDFDHRFFDRARRPDPHADAVAALTDDADRGDPWTRGHTQGATRAQIAGAFGERVGAAVAGAPLHEWSGPYPSPYGSHLVRVTERTPAHLPPLEEVRGRVREDLVSDRKRTLVRERLDALAVSQSAPR